MVCALVLPDFTGPEQREAGLTICAAVPMDGSRAGALLQRVPRGSLTISVLK